MKGFWVAYLITAVCSLFVVGRYLNMTWQLGGYLGLGDGIVTVCGGAALGSVITVSLAAFGLKKLLRKGREGNSCGR